MKRVFRIFDLSKSEQRVVLIVMFLLVALAVIGYERRIHHSAIASASATRPEPSPTVVETINDE